MKNKTNLKENTLKKYLNISRPRFWIYLFGPFLIGLATGDITKEKLNADLIILGFYFLFPANFLLYGVNDIFDYATDKYNPKKKYYEELVNPKYQKRIFQIALLLSLPFFIFGVSISIKVGTLLGLFIILSLQYSSPPIRAKSKPFLDMAFNGLYIIPGIISYLVITGTYPSASIIIASILWTMAMHAYSALPDIHADKKAEINTVATLLGFVPTLYLCFLLYSLSAIIIFPYLGIFSLLIAVVYITLITVSLINDEKSIFKYYKTFPYINTIVGGLIFLYLILK